MKFVIVSLPDVIEAMELVSDEATAYINQKTGELITLTHEELALADFVGAESFEQLRDFIIRHPEFVPVQN